MTKTNKGFVSLCIPLLTLLILVSSCEDPGSVGSQYVNSPKLTFDTLSISQTQLLSYDGYSGRLGFIPIGQYSDPLFGDITLNGLYKPVRNPPLPDSIDLADDFQMKLKVSLDSLESYGDTLSQSSFSIYEVTSSWRSSALKISDQQQFGDLVGSFTVSNEKEIVVDLSQQWVDEYKAFYNSDAGNVDSTYNYEFGGLAIVNEQQNSKISFSRSDRTNFLFINGAASDTTDTLNVALRDWGFTLNRSGENLSSDTFPLHTTMESLLSITMPNAELKAQNETKNIIRADLLFYEDQDLLTSNLPAGNQRLDVASLKLHLKETIEPIYEYQFGNVEFTGIPVTSREYYKINITNYVNDVIFGEQPFDELILGIGSNSGAIRSTALFNTTAPEQFQPKIIITSLVD